MSGIAGVFAFDGSPVDQALVHAMTDAVRHRGPDAGGCWSDACAGMGQRTLRSMPEPLPERLPHHDAAEQLCVVFDGRLDNREELLRLLRLDAGLHESMPDPALLLRAYREWREDLPRRILGDFAFAIWDGRRKALFCARDILGLRPFHYALGLRRIVFGSELRQMFLDPGVSDALNEGMVGEYLAWAITSSCDTLYRDIRRLPPAHSMTVEMGGRVRLQRYWDIDLGARIRHPRIEDYERQYVQLLTECVNCRLRVHGPAGSQLSGGLDSSAVTVIGHQRARARGIGLEAYSVAYPGLPCDESEHSKAVARHAGVHLNLVPNVETGASRFVERAAQARDLPGYPMSNFMIGSVGAAARGRGCRVMLTGEGGDEFFGGDPDLLADLLGGFRYFELWREAVALGTTLAMPAARVFLRHAVKPWLRRAALRLGAMKLRRRDLSWISPGWAAQVGLRDRIAPRPHSGARASCAQLAAYAGLHSAHNTHFYEMLDLNGFAAGLEYRHPMLDRRLIEFSFAVPQTLHLRQGRGKSLARTAMRGLLPDSAIEPGSNVDFSIVNVRALDAILGDQPLAGWPVVRAGWARADVLESAYRRARADLLAGGRWSGRPIWNLWMAYAVGLVAVARRNAAQPI